MKHRQGMLTVAGLCAALCVQAREKMPYAPGCAHSSPQQCVIAAMDAMGGREQLEQLKTMRMQTMSHTALTEQSYRQAPFITSYERSTMTIDWVNQRLLKQEKLTWPEADFGQADSDTTLVAGPDGGVYHTKFGDSPCSLADLNAARQEFALAPARILLTAAAAADLHFESPQTIRSTAHATLAFTWRQIPVRLMLNPFNHLPDAVETTQVFHDFWYFWGDVRQRRYYDNWKWVGGISYPSNLIEERNGVMWRSTQALDVQFNIPLDDKAFEMNAGAVQQSGASPGWNRAFKAAKPTVLAPGIDLYAGAWNTTIVKEPDGVVVLEAPISSTYTRGVLREARRGRGGLPITAVLSTSDSWPHTGGVREVVAQGLPVYILDLNRSLLDRLVSAPHALEPDALEKAANAKPHWKIVTAKVEIGSGTNRMELYPLRGASTERQYMVYFPTQRLLYASDTLSLNDDGTLYDPELMWEVAQAVTREHLSVDTVFAMHQGPMAWQEMMTLLEKSRGTPSVDLQ